MNRDMDGEETKSAAEVLERIRWRLKEQVRSGFPQNLGRLKRGAPNKSVSRASVFCWSRFKPSTAKSAP